MGTSKKITEFCKAHGMTEAQFRSEANNMTNQSYTAKELLPILEKTNAYGFERFKTLISF
jgi:hypothetical protein